MYGGGPFPHVLHNSAMSQNQPTLPYMPPPAMQRYPLPFQMPTDQTMNPYNPLNLLIQSAIVRLVMSLAIANTNLPLQTNTGRPTFFFSVYARKNKLLFVSPGGRKEHFIIRVIFFIHLILIVYIFTISFQPQRS